MSVNPAHAYPFHSTHHVRDPGPADVWPCRGVPRPLPTPGPVQRLLGLPGGGRVGGPLRPLGEQPA